jgi:hypothetical protein
MTGYAEILGHLSDLVLQSHFVIWRSVEAWVQARAARRRL